MISFGAAKVFVGAPPVANIFGVKIVRSVNPFFPGEWLTFGRRQLIQDNIPMSVPPHHGSILDQILGSGALLAIVRTLLIYHRFDRHGTDLNFTLSPFHEIFPKIFFIYHKWRFHEHFFTVPQSFFPSTNND